MLLNLRSSLFGPHQVLQSPTTAKIPLSPENQLEMDPLIWSQLPEELLERIFCFLPLKSIFFLRPTSRYFRNLVLDPSFISKYYSLSPSSASSSFLLLSHPYLDIHFHLYDFTLGTWIKLPHSIHPSVDSSTLLAASNGLLCFSLLYSSSLLVCNPLCKSSRVVGFPSFPFSFELLTLVSSRGGFKIFVLSSLSLSCCAFVYDSEFKSWSKFDGFGRVLSASHQQSGAYRNGCLYFTTSCSFSVVCFDLETGEWRSPVGELPGELTFVRLVSDGRGKLYMVGGIGTNGISKRLRLWELIGNRHDDEEKWVEIETLPDTMLRKLVAVCYHNYERVYCFWHKGSICIGCSTWPEILHYRVARRTWHWLPRCPSLPDKWSCGFRWFSFVPGLCSF